MSISARIETTIERWTTLWKERLRGWAVSVVTLGLEGLMKAIEKAAAPHLKPLINKMEETGEVPEELKPMLKALKEPTGAWPALLAMGAGGGMMAGALGQITDALFGGLGRAMMKKTTTKIMDVVPLINAARRTSKEEVDYYGHMAELGFDKTWADWWWIVSEHRLDPGMVTTAWRRDKAKYEKLFSDLKDQGWDDDRIKALKFATLVYPGPRDMVDFQAHEVFEPDMIAKYGLDAEVEGIERERFYEIGMSDEIIEEYWRNHWVHPAWGQVLDMYHRDELTYDDVWSWFRVIEIPPYWRDKMIAISWSLPNRIETRMMARYGLVDKAWLVEHLKRIGLHEDYRSIAADFMLAMGIRMDVAARYSKGWLTADEVKSEIATFGMSEDINDRLYKWIVKNVTGDRVEAERSATATEVMKAVKKGFIAWDEGIERLARMGYSEEEADFKLNVYVGVAEGSPETYMEFVDLTERYRLAMGLEAKIPPPELIEAGKALKEAETARKEAIDRGIKEEKLAPYEKAVSDAQYRYRQLLTKWKEETKRE